MHNMFHVITWYHLSVLQVSFSSASDFTFLVFPFPIASRKYNIIQLYQCKLSMHNSMDSFDVFQSIQFST